MVTYSRGTHSLAVALCQHFYGLFLDIVPINRDCYYYPDAARLMANAQERQ
jgi:hypothetical protein